MSLFRVGRWFVWCLCLTVAGVLVAAWMYPENRATPMDIALPPIAPQDQNLTIVAFGTSLTSGSDWPTRLENRLNACLSIEATVHVVAEPGEGSAWALANLGRVAELNPELVIVEFAINDADLLDGVWLSKSAAQHRALIGSLKRQPKGPAILMAKMNPVHGAQRLLRPFLRLYYGVYDTLAKDMDTGLVDLEARWHALLQSGERFPDGLHPESAIAAQVIVPVIANAISRAVEESSC